MLSFKNTNSICSIGFKRKFGSGSRTSYMYHLVSQKLKTRMCLGSAGFLLSQAFSGSNIRYQQNDGSFVGTFKYLPALERNEGGAWYVCGSHIDHSLGNLIFSNTGKNSTITYVQPVEVSACPYKSIWHSKKLQQT